MIVDFSLEALDFIHRLYQSEESIKILRELVSTKLFMSLIVLQVLLGMLVPLLILVVVRSGRFNEDLRKLLYFTSALLIQLGIFSTRWNVVIGGQLFSKSFRGLMAYKMETHRHRGPADRVAAARAAVHHSDRAVPGAAATVDGDKRPGRGTWRSRRSVRRERITSRKTAMKKLLFH